MSTVHHLKISLSGIRPPIWREILVPSDVRLDRLHLLFQIVMGWENDHLHEFTNGARGARELRYGPKSPDSDDGMFGSQARDERKATLLDLAPKKGDRFFYLYDFGDSWDHEVSVKAIGAPNDQRPAPMCIKATGACPPEDCGGPYGYMNLLEALADPRHEQHADLLDWIGGDWDAEFYDIIEVNKQLAELASRWRASSRKAKR